MGKDANQPLPEAVTSSKRSNTNRLAMRSLRRKRSGIYLESTEAEKLGVLPHQCIRVKDAMSRSVSVVTPRTEIREAVRLMKVLDVGALIVYHGRTVVGTLSYRDIALANVPHSETIHKVMTSDPVYCYENDLLIDAHALMRRRGLTALPVRDFSGLLSGIVMRTAGTTVTFLLLVAMIIAGWLSATWSADLAPVPPPPVESRPERPQGPTPPPSRIDPGIERRPQTIPDPRSAVTPPNVDPKMTIDPETAPPATEKTKPDGSNDPPSKPSPR
jgi:CBS domain-containing protein